jgi:S1-C subfamily serine protease
MNQLLTTFNSEMAAVIQRVQQSLVQVQNGRRGNGAGTIWHEDGLVLTNAHVVQRQQPQVTLWDGRSYSSQLLAYDEKHDLAALAIQADNLPTVELGNSKSLRAGDWVIAAGHPWGITGAVSAGAVIALGVPLELPNYPGELIQVGLQLRPGHSGGPLVDGRGRLLGINTMIAGPQVGLVIPVHVVADFLKEKLGRAARAETAVQFA